MSNFRLAAYVLSAFALLTLWSRCSLEEDFLSDSGTLIRLSADTLSFDTVFTELGSATRSFKIYNPHNRPLQLKSVRVESNAGGRFRINVDGLSGTEIKDIFIPADDSIYVFAEVTVNPDDPIGISPFVLEGRVVVLATDQEQSVLLVAFGQNANYLPLSRTRAGFSLLTCDLGEVVFDDPKPYVLYGSLVVDSCTLVLPEGTRFYVHGGIASEVGSSPPAFFNDGGIFFVNRGKLRVEGSAERPVIIATDRLEDKYIQRPGQYSGIRLLRGTGPHVIEHAIIRNGVLGIYVDSLVQLNIQNSEVSYTSSDGIACYQATLKASNTLIHSNGGAGLSAARGGNIQLDYCTIVNYSGQNPAVSLSNAAEIDRKIFYGQLEAQIRNSIIFGSNRDPLSMAFVERPDLFSYSVSNSVLRITDLPRTFPNFKQDCQNCLFPSPSDALFVNIRQDSFQLDTLSIAQGKALPIPEILLDLPGRLRDANMPDIGAFEFQDK